jgi:hypothetical protein
MKLRKLEIELHCYGDFKDKYTARMEYEGSRGKVVLTLDPAVSHALLAFIGPTITKFSQETSKQLESSIAQSLIEANAPQAIESA